MLRVEHLTLRLGNTTVLREIDAQFEPGRITFIHGASGAGKTSLLRALAGLERSSRGNVMHGTTVWQSDSQWLHPWKRGDRFRRAGSCAVAAFDRDGTRYFPLSARDGWTRATRRTRAAEILDLLDLRSLSARRPAELSGGEQQRVAIARAR